ncbi:hypothetical protein D3C71_1555630 [compost metagenome]
MTKLRVRPVVVLVETRPSRAADHQRVRVLSRVCVREEQTSVQSLVDGTHLDHDNEASTVCHEPILHRILVEEHDHVVGHVDVVVVGYAARQNPGHAHHADEERLHLRRVDTAQADEHLVVPGHARTLEHDVGRKGCAGGCLPRHAPILADRNEGRVRGEERLQFVPKVDVVACHASFVCHVRLKCLPQHGRRYGSLARNSGWFVHRRASPWLR